MVMTRPARSMQESGTFARMSLTKIELTHGLLRGQAAEDSWNAQRFVCWRTLRSLGVLGD